MGILERLTTAFSRRSGEQWSGPDRRRRQVPPRPSRPVAVEFEGGNGDMRDESAGSENGEAGERSPIVAPRSRQEMLGELQKNYAEVLELVRKVSGHLDKQDERAARLMEIAERLPAAMDALPQIREQNAQTLSALNRLVELGVAEGESSRAATDELASIKTRLEQARETELELVSTMASFRESVSDVSRASERVGVAVEGLDRRGAQRDAQLAEAMNAGRRWTVALLATSGAATLVALAAVVISLTT